MSLNTTIQTLAKTAAHIDPCDLPGLVALQDDVVALAQSLKSDAHQPMQDALTSAARLIEQLTLREVDDVDAALRDVHQSIALAQRMADAVERGQSLSSTISDSATSATVRSAAATADANERISFGPVLPHDEFVHDVILESREHLASAEGALLRLERNVGDAELVNTVFRAFHSIKGVACIVRLGPIVELAHGAECLLDQARTGSRTLDDQTLSLILQACDVIAQLLSALKGAEAPKKCDFDDLMDRLARAAQGGGDAAKASPAAVEPVAELSQSTSAHQFSSAGASTSVRKRRDQAVKVSARRLDSLVTMVGELVIAQQMVLQDVHLRQIHDQRFQRNLAHSGKIIRDLQEIAMSLCMVTLRATFQKLARLVRDASSTSGKKIQLHLEGEDTELDRNVVEEIADPLVHMIRNSCDHGIENVEDRRAAGKDVTGHLSLRASHQGGSLIIEVEDDGRGLCRQKIVSKAIEHGIISDDRDVSEMSDREVYNLIMLPGFSTAEAITDISGRGVGMDVVRRNIEALRGKVEIESTPGQGTLIRMALPLTMAIIDGMVVRVGAQRYVIPTHSIERSFRPRAEQLHSIGGRGVMASMRGSLLPVHRLNRLFNLKEGCNDPLNALLIVIESNDARCCLLVDEILGQQQVVIKSLGRGMTTIPSVSGGAILGDGRVALIIDVGGLIGQATCLAA